MAEILVDEYYIERLKNKIENLERKISNLNQENKTLQDSVDHAEYRIRTELEPRIKQEQRCYDYYVSQQTGERECDHFTSTIDKLCDFVDENKQYFDWDEYDGDLYQMILWLINMRDDINHFYIGEYDNDIDYDKD